MYDSLDHFIWLAGDVGQLLLLTILIVRGLHRTFPVFSAYLSWQIFSDLLLFLALSGVVGLFRRNYIPFYYSLSIINYLFELGVLLEIGAHVLRPARRALPRGVLYFLLGLTLAIGLAYFLATQWLKPAQFTNLRLFLATNATAAILCIVVFLLIASFSQVLGLSWKNHVLQLATGFAFYSIVELVMELMQSQLHAGPDYGSRFIFWGRVEIVGYVGTVFFWCYAFLKQEAPRKEFSPQMQKILVQLSGSAKRQTAVLARSREP